MRVLFLSHLTDAARLSREAPPRCRNSRALLPGEETFPTHWASLWGSRLPLGPPARARPLALRTQGLSLPSSSSRNVPELTCHPGAHPSSHGNCLPSALRNHLWLAAVGTQHSCPLPAAWPNKQRCFLLRLALPGWVSYPSTHRPPPPTTAPAAPTPPPAPHSSQSITHSESGLSGIQGERQSELTSSCSFRPTARGVSKHQADGGGQVLELQRHRDLGPNPLSTCRSVTSSQAPHLPKPPFLPA